MVSNIGQLKRDQVKSADIQRYAMDILKMPSGGDHEKLHEISQLSRIIHNNPDLAEGLTPFALDLSLNGYPETLSAICNAAPQYLDSAAVELFAHRHAASASKELEEERINSTFVLSDCVRAKPELANTLTVYSLNYALNDAPHLLDTILEAAPGYLDTEALNRFLLDLRNIDEHDPKRQAAASEIISTIHKARQGLESAAPAL